MVAVSQRLRPMAEQLLAESGSSVADVLLQLLEVRAALHSSTTWVQPGVRGAMGTCQNG